MAGVEPGHGQRPRMSRPGPGHDEIRESRGFLTWARRRWMRSEVRMANTLVGRKRIRKFFGKIKEVAEMPNLIEVQKASYDQFLMVEEPKGGRGEEGLQAVFKSVFPISDF